jgi:hypothetical protein
MFSKTKIALVYGIEKKKKSMVIAGRGGGGLQHYIVG